MTALYTNCIMVQILYICITYVSTQDLEKGEKCKNIFFSSNIIIGVSIWIIICELNKVYKMSVWWRNAWHERV